MIDVDCGLPKIGNFGKYWKPAVNISPQNLIFSKICDIIIIQSRKPLFLWLSSDSATGKVGRKTKVAVDGNSKLSSRDLKLQQMCGWQPTAIYICSSCLVADGTRLVYQTDKANVRHQTKRYFNRITMYNRF